MADLLPYYSSALCWNTSRLQLYKHTCIVPDRKANRWEYNHLRFDCGSYLPYDFYAHLYSSGEHHQCVCRFVNNNAVRTFVGYSGSCNGACLSKGGFLCDGMMPVPNLDEERDIVKEISTSIGNDTTSTNVAVPLTISWKMMLCVATVLLGNGLV